MMLVFVVTNYENFYDFKSIMTIKNQIHNKVRFLGFK